jgi:hypothetical protein
MRFARQSVEVAQKNEKHIPTGAPRFRQGHRFPGHIAHLDIGRLLTNL